MELDRSRPGGPVPKALERLQLGSAELNHVDMSTWRPRSIWKLRWVACLPTPPDAVTEYTLCLGLTRNGKIHRLCAMRIGNFTLAGLLQEKGPDAS